MTHKPSTHVKSQKKCIWCTPIRILNMKQYIDQQHMDF